MCQSRHVYLVDCESGLCVRVDMFTWLTVNQDDVSEWTCLPGWLWIRMMCQSGHVYLVDCESGWCVRVDMFTWLTVNQDYVSEWTCLPVVSKHTALKTKSWLTVNQDDVSEWTCLPGWLWIRIMCQSRHVYLVDCESGWCVRVDMFTWLTVNQDYVSEWTCLPVVSKHTALKTKSWLTVNQDYVSEWTCLPGWLWIRMMCQSGHVYLVDCESGWCVRVDMFTWLTVNQDYVSEWTCLPVVSKHTALKTKSWLTVNQDYVSEWTCLPGWLWIRIMCQSGHVYLWCLSTQH